MRRTFFAATASGLTAAVLCLIHSTAYGGNHGGSSARPASGGHVSAPSASAGVSRPAAAARSYTGAYAGARGYYGRPGLSGRPYISARALAYYNNMGRFAGNSSRPVGRSGVSQFRNSTPSLAYYTYRRPNELNRGTRNDLSVPRAGNRSGRQNTAVNRGGVIREQDLSRDNLSRQPQTRLTSQTVTPSFSDAQRRHRSNCDNHNHDGHDRCHHHGRNWWHNHCDTIVLINGGYWGWWNGWWYPAWGYDPYYADYEYDGPIYGYDGLPPDDAVANVQTELQRLGYYDDAVDGTLGPVTQQALRRFQRDRRIAVTGAIDPPTVRALGLN